MKYVTFSGSCVNCITCWSHAIQGKHGRRSRVRRSGNCCCHLFYSCISHLWYATERDRVYKNRYEASGIDTLSNSGARGWTSFKRNILYAIRSLNGVEINRSVCIHAQTARRCRTRRVHSSINTATPTRRVPFASTENTSRCGLSVPDEPDAVDAGVYRGNPTRTVRERYARRVKLQVWTRP